MASRLSRMLDAVESTLNDPTVKFQIGQVRNQENTQRRRVVWVRAGGSIEAPSRTGGKLVSGARAKQCYTLEDRVEAHIYAEDDNLVETLFKNVLAALHLTLGPNVEPLSYRWPTEEPGKADIAVRQPKVVLLIGFKVPVLETIDALTTIDSFDHTGTFDGEEVC